MTIRDVLIPALRGAFPDRGLLTPESGELVAEFPPLCPEVGRLLVYDDGDEAMVAIENITHHHVNPYNETLTKEERYNWIRDSVMEFLADLFADRVLLWSVNQGKGGGGWRIPFEGVVPDDLPSGAEAFVWTRKLS